MKNKNKNNEMDEIVYVVIVTFNGTKWIDKCLNSIPNHYQIIVVDNNSTDTTVQFIQEKYPSITLIQQSKNLGFGGANNIGISHAIDEGADYVFLLNQDAYVEANTIEKLIEVHKDNQQYGILSPIHLNGEGTKLDFNFSNFIGVNKQLQYDALKHSFSQDIYEVPFVNAAAWLLPRKTLEEIGGFDPLFYHYSEDDNYCHRVLFHKLKIGVVPDVSVLHDRELRPKIKVNNDVDKFKLMERQLKQKWSNINIEVAIDISKTKKKLKRLILKLIIKLKFDKAHSYYKELELIQRIESEIMNSRATNKKSDSNYI